ncbi:MAG: hypothetical protein H0V31_07385 [Acidobacteria bacterium]|jgi:hypothetical protein|nr:hypothetical protein [Acidobacteriota bacterium]
MDITISLPENTERSLRKQAQVKGQNLKTIIEEIIEISVNQDSVRSFDDKNTAEFETDMLSFAEGTETIPAYNGNHSRQDIYFDHD